MKDPDKIKTCPTCEQTIEGLVGVHIDLEANVAIIDDRAVFFTAKEAEIFSLLYERAPAIVTKEMILTALYLHVADEPELKIVEVFICKIRAKLRGTRAIIDTIWGRGYRFKLDEHKNT